MVLQYPAKAVSVTAGVSLKPTTLGLPVSGAQLLGGVSPTFFDTDALALFDAMVPAPNAARKTLINTLILALKSAGIWTRLDVLYVTAAHAAQPATRNWKAPTGTFNLAATGTIPFVVDRGFTGDGVTGYLETGWSPIGGVQFQQDSAHISGWSLTAGAASDTERLIGNTSAVAPETVLRPRGVGDLFGIVVNDATVSTTIPSVNRDGFFVGNRSGAGARQGYRNGVLLGSDTQASTGRGVSTMTFDRDDTVFSTIQVAQGSAGSSLSAGLVTSYYNALQSYMTAVGAA